MLNNGLKNLIMISDDAEKLVMSERKSFMPATLAIITLMAYLGPNAEILGGMKYKLWHFQGTIPDIQKYCLKVSLLLVADWVSFVLNAIILWLYCRINILDSLKDLQKTFWIVFMFVENLHMLEVLFNREMRLYNSIKIRIISGLLDTSPSGLNPETLRN